MESNDGFNKSNYLKVPPLLVSVTGLETYLSRLSIQLSSDISALRKRIEECSFRVTDSGNTVSKVKRFLLVNARRSMEECLFGASDEGNDVETDNFLNESISFNLKGVDEAASDAELLGAVLGVATKLIRNNAKLKAALNESVSATHSFISIQEDIQQQLKEMREQMEQHKCDFDGLSMWLGTYDPDKHATHLPPSGMHAQATDHEMGGSEDFHPIFSSAIEKEVDTIFTRSPLLLALRRIVTRELSDRVAHFSDINAKDVEGAVEKVRDELSSYSLPPSLKGALGSQQAQELTVLLSNYDRRLKSIENFVQQDRVAIEALKSNVNSGGLTSFSSAPNNPAQAEAARRARDQYADLEERLTFLEIEREEFRSIFRTLLEWNQQHQSIPTQLRDQLQHYASPAPSLDGMNSRVQLSDWHGDPNTTGVSPITLSTRTMGRIEGKRIFPTEELLRASAGLANAGSGRPAVESNLDIYRSATASPPVGDSRAAGGAAASTGDQTSYTRYITDVFNRKDVNKLPPLPYEPILKR